MWLLKKKKKILMALEIYLTKIVIIVPHKIYNIIFI